MKAILACPSLKIDSYPLSSVCRDVGDDDDSIRQQASTNIDA